MDEYQEYLEGALMSGKVRKKRKRNADRAFRLSKIAVRTNVTSASGHREVTIESSCPVTDDVLGTKPWKTQWEYTPAGQHSIDHFELTAIDPRLPEPLHTRAPMDDTQANKVSEAWSILSKAPVGE